MKTGGFNLENTHVYKAKRLINLICIVAIAFCLALKAGRLVADKSKSKLKNTGYMAKSISRLSLDALFELIFHTYKYGTEEPYNDKVFRLDAIKTMKNRRRFNILEIYY